MNSLLSFRTSSRSSSPAPTGGPPTDLHVTDEVPRPSALSRIHTLAAFHRSSPAPLPPPTPTPTPDGYNYLDVLTLKLAESASRALSAPTTAPSSEPCLLNGKWPIPAGRGRAFGALITSELRAAQDNLHLYRAIKRLVHRPLSALLTTLAASLPPLVSSPSFLPVSSLATPSPTLIHALAFSQFAAELLECFESIGLGSTSVGAGPAFEEGLKEVREGLENIVTMVVTPLVAAVKAEIAPLIGEFENLPASKGLTLQKSGVGPTVTKSGSKAAVPQLSALAQLMPHVARALTRYTSPQCASSRSALATLHISLTWRALVALAHRPLPCSVVPITIPTPPATPPPSVVLKKSLTPPATPPGGRFSIRLPKEPSLTFTNPIATKAVSARRSSTTLALSRPPSPPAEVKPPLVVLAHDGKMLQELLTSLPRPAVGTLASEAVGEATDAFDQFIASLNALSSQQRTTAVKYIVGEDVPTLIALPILLRTLPLESPIVVHTLLGLSATQYRAGCLTGFGTAEECEPYVGEAVLKALQKPGAFPDCREKEEIVDWLRNQVEH